MAAKQIGEAWLAWVDEAFLLQEGAIRPQVVEEYQRLAQTDAIREERELWRSYTDDKIEKILKCPAEQRGQLLAAIDIRSLAFVQDRIQSGTELLTALVQQGLQLRVTEDSLPDFFRQLLLQSPPAPAEAEQQPEPEEQAELDQQA